MRRVGFFLGAVTGNELDERSGVRQKRLKSCVPHNCWSVFVKPDHPRNQLSEHLEVIVQDARERL